MCTYELHAPYAPTLAQVPATAAQSEVPVAEPYGTHSHGVCSALRAAWCTPAEVLREQEVGGDHLRRGTAALREPMRSGPSVRTQSQPRSVRMPCARATVTACAKALRGKRAS